MIDYHYGYLMVSALIFPVWLFLFFHRKDCRKAMLFIGIFNGLLTIPQEIIFLKSYWRPDYLYPLYVNGTQIGGIEDFLYGFFFAGIASVVYEELFGRKHAKRLNRKHHWSWFAVPFFIIANLVFFVPNNYGINPIYTTFFSCIVVISVMAFFRRDLIKDIVMSGVIMGVLNFLGYFVFLSIFPDVINKWWMLSNISGVLVLGIPIEEILFGFAIGFVAGPVYEFLMGLRFRKNPS